MKSKTRIWQRLKDLKCLKFQKLFYDCTPARSIIYDDSPLMKFKAVKLICCHQSMQLLDLSILNPKSQAFIDMLKTAKRDDDVIEKGFRNLSRFKLFVYSSTECNF